VFIRSRHVSCFSFFFFCVCTQSRPDPGRIRIRHRGIHVKTSCAHCGSGGIRVTHSRAHQQLALPAAAMANCEEPLRTVSYADAYVQAEGSDSGVPYDEPSTSYEQLIVVIDESVLNTSESSTHTFPIPCVGLCQVETQTEFSMSTCSSPTRAMVSCAVGIDCVNSVEVATQIESGKSINTGEVATPFLPLPLARALPLPPSFPPLAPPKSSWLPNLGEFMSQSLVEDDWSNWELHV
jgi:hypothetical protein